MSAYPVGNFNPSLRAVAGFQTFGAHAVYNFSKSFVLACFPCERSPR